MAKNISFISFNARSLLHKIDELRTLLPQWNKQPEVIAVSETWCNPSEKSAAYNIDGYTIYRADHSSRSGGGTCLYIRDGIDHSLLFTTLDDGLESVWLSLPYGNRHLIVASIYRPPSADVDSSCHQLEMAIRKSRNSINAAPSEFLLLGDFNAKHTEWYSADSTDAAGESFNALFRTYGLEQLVTFPTHLYRGSLSSCLDLVATTCPSDTSSVYSIAPIGHSDHVTIVGDILLSLPSCTLPPLQLTHLWCWRQDNVAAAREALSNALAGYAIADHSSLDECWQNWKHVVITCLKQHCQQPHKAPHKPLIHPPRPWITSQLKEQINIKHKLYRLYLAQRTSTAWCAFKQQRNTVTRLLRESKSAYVCASGDVHAPRLHTLVRSLTSSTNTNLPPTVAVEGRDVSGQASQAEEFNKFFVSQSQKSVDPNTSQDLPQIRTPPASTSLTAFTATVSSVEKALRDLDPRKAAGYDGIPTRILKEAACELAPSLTHVFNASFAKGHIPQEWRDATITPVHKKGDRKALTNYRPISLLSVISKVQERIVYDQLYNHIAPYIPVHQSGFCPNDGTELQLSRLLHQISASRECGKSVISCFFDLSKAFDRVWHKGLIAKLEHYGVHEHALQWFKAYLYNRRQRTKVGGAYSSWRTIPAGVPQGSVLGPLLFLIYTADLPQACLNSYTTCSQFADDTALLAAAHSFQDAEDSLQTAVTSAGDWLLQWHLLVNTSKTVVMVFHHDNRPPTRQPCITLDGVQLAVVMKHRHLGVDIEHDFGWSSHVSAVLNKASSRLHMFHRLKSSLNRPALKYLYTTYIRPIIEYASIAVTPLPVYLQDRIERFQRKAARICLNLPLFTPVNHSSILHSLELPTAESRRKLKLVLFAHAIYFEYAPQHILDLNVQHASTSYALRHKRTFNIPICRTDRHTSSPVNFALHLYNQLPTDVRLVPQKSAFKHQVKSLLLSSVCSCSAHPVIRFSVH